MGRRQDLKRHRALIGKRFGTRIITATLTTRKGIHAECLCDCGHVTLVRAYLLCSLNRLSCFYCKNRSALDYKKQDSKNKTVNLTDQDVIQAHRQRMMATQSPKEIKAHQRYLIIRHIARSDQKPEVRLADADRLFKDEPLTSKEVSVLTGMSLKKVNQVYNTALANMKIKYREIYEDV